MRATLLGMRLSDWMGEHLMPFFVAAEHRGTVPTPPMRANRYALGMRLSDWPGEYLMPYWLAKLGLFFVAAERLSAFLTPLMRATLLGMRFSDWMGEHLMPYWSANSACSLSQLSFPWLV
jgi:hypothetical protein